MRKVPNIAVILNTRARNYVNLKLSTPFSKKFSQVDREIFSTVS